MHWIVHSSNCSLSLSLSLSLSSFNPTSGIRARLMRSMPLNSRGWLHSCRLGDRASAGFAGALQRNCHARNQDEAGEGVRNPQFGTPFHVLLFQFLSSTDKRLWGIHATAKRLQIRSLKRAVDSQANSSNRLVNSLRFRFHLLPFSK